MIINLIKESLSVSRTINGKIAMHLELYKFIYALEITKRLFFDHILFTHINI